MSPEMEQLRSQPAVTASVVAAALGFTLFCGIAIAVVLGWIGPGHPPLPVNRPVAQVPKAPSPPPAPAPLATGSGDLGLEAGESVVEAPARTAAVPQSAGERQQVAPAPPRFSQAPGAEPRRSARHYRYRERERERGPRPQTPAYARVPHPTDPDDDWPRSISRR
jgi:hypothetical protein